MNIIGVRRAHRWLAIGFVAAVLITVIGLSLSGPEWVVYLPLIPLAGLFLTGSVIYVLVYRGSRTGPAVGGRVRQVHRWSAVVFVVAVVATVIALAQQEPVVWVSYLPLIPLAGLLLSGSVMLVSPLLRARRPASGG